MFYNYLFVYDGYNYKCITKYIFTYILLSVFKYFFSLTLLTYRKHIIKKKYFLDNDGTYEHTEKCILKLILVQNTIIGHCCSCSVTFVTEEVI